MDFSLSVGCPPGYDKIGDSCYHLVSEKYTFEEGKKMCQKTGGYLLAIQSSKENDAVAAAYEMGKFGGFYLGGTIGMGIP